MRGRYFWDMSIVRAGGDNNVPAPEENEVVIYRSFFKAGLRFLPSLDHPRSHNKNGDFCLSNKESRARAKSEMLLQYARTSI
jgi:hypothetical protein